MSDINGKPYQQWLAEELGERKARNPNYSLRAFALYLGVGRTTLSEVLRTRRQMSRKNALKIAERLSLESDQVHSLITQIRSKKQ